MNKTGIAVFGGSFNPPTVAHIDLAKQILKEMEEIEKVIFVPVSTKYNKKGLAPDKDRLNMLKNICNDEKGLEVSSVELDSNRQLYTFETLRKIKKQYQNKDIYFVLGTDNLKELETWHTPNKILEEFKILVLERNNDVMEEIIVNSKFLKKHKSSIIKIDGIEKINISSSFVREELKLGKPIHNLVPEEIRAEVERIYK